MKIDWTKYQNITSTMKSTRIEDMIHMMVESYLRHESTERTVTELKYLEILIPTEEDTKQIVKPFNFVTNDGSQES
jgi:hypothetical protein